ncbi:universal stress protein [Streptacidiphilus neutrinimicus]|uniref:universal stress protein n=1 Tax=Streptacidiphilus neutrinimicus TaxID=105420 RepID=UPI000693EC78|nr:universal stress protein [Streptacidiphilus neutrinimicus]
MQDRDAGQVVVGVDDSLAGLRALREAVDLARRGGMEVRAVRSYRPPPETGGGWWYPGIGPRAFCDTANDELREGLRRDAMAAVMRAFDLAMGGAPRDVVVCIEPEDVPLCRALPAAAHREDDVLVVPVPGRRHWWWPHGRTLARRCLDRAVCPVLLVPSPEAARELDGRWTPWRRLRRRRELAAILDELAA